MSQSIGPLENEKFNAFYAEALGRDRWEVLKSWLIRDSRKTELENPFQENHLDLKKIYELDFASLIPPKHLNIQPGDRVLDMCAAPGGKSLAMIFSVMGDGDWVLNELSRPRLSRLRRVVREYLPAQIIERVKTTNHDASLWGFYEPEAYDKILLDAPCSGEQHLLANASEIKKWSVSRTKRLAQRQYGLLCAGLLALKPGGRLVYSTCSVSPLENDQVLAKYMKKKKDTVRVCHSQEGIGEPTDFGRQIWPDQCDGWGPIYYSVLEKL